MITLLEKTNSLGVMTLKTSCLSNLAISVTPIVNTSNMLICSRGFLDCLQPKLFDAKDIDARGAYPGCTCTGVSCFEGACGKSAYIGNACVKNTCIEAGHCSNSACIGTSSNEGAGGTFFRGAGVRNAYIGVVCCTNNTFLHLRVVLDKL